MMFIHLYTAIYNVSLINRSPEAGTYTFRRKDAIALLALLACLLVFQTRVREVLAQHTAIHIMQHPA